MIAGVLLVKSAIWIVSLGSGTSAECSLLCLMMGAALGGVEGAFSPAMRERASGPGQHGGDSGRHHARSFYGDSVCSRINT